MAFQNYMQEWDVMPCILAEIYQHFSTEDEGTVQLKCDGTR